jgi:hypothetical protein
MSMVQPPQSNFLRSKIGNHNQHIAATPTVSNAMSIPTKLFSLANSGLRFVFPAVFLVEALLVAEAVLVVLEAVIAPDTKV